MIKKILLGILILLVIGAGIAYYGYGLVFNPNTNFTSEVYEVEIIPGSSFDSLATTFEENDVIKDVSSFKRVAGWMNYDKEEITSGRFLIEKGWSNRQIISLLRSGVQAPVDLTFNNVRNVEELSGKIASQLYLDSLTLLNQIYDPLKLENFGLTKENVLTMFIPNTYKVYWNITPEKLLNRLNNEAKSFWSKNNRLSKAADLDMSSEEIYTLASIVEKESQYGPERPTIAGLYLNRIQNGILLQADPTVVFASGIYDLRRVLNKHLAIDSPYNTYMYEGLPPGPIYMPSIESIDAVLNHEKHDYLYMCAKPGFGTQHAFAKTLRGHNENARVYRNWLNQQNIK